MRRRKSPVTDLSRADSKLPRSDVVHGRKSNEDFRVVYK